MSEASQTLTQILNIRDYSTPRNISKHFFKRICYMPKVKLIFSKETNILTLLLRQANSFLVRQHLEPRFLREKKQTYSVDAILRICKEWICLSNPSNIHLTILELISFLHLSKNVNHFSPSFKITHAKIFNSISSNEVCLTIRSLKTTTPRSVIFGQL